MEKINEDLLMKILVTYEYGTQKGLREVKEMFENSPHPTESHNKIRAIGCDVYAEWEDIFRLRNYIKNMGEKYGAETSS